jgi:hypothetical protein
MLKKFFHWRADQLVLLFFTSGLTFWGLAIATEPIIPLFLAACFLFFCGFVWSMGWLWTHDFKQEGHKPKDAEILRGQFRKILPIATVILIISFCSIECLLWISYKARLSDVGLGTVSVAFDDNQQMPGFEVPSDDQNLFKELNRAESLVRPVIYKRSPYTDTSVTNVIVRNTSDVPIKDATVMITCNCAIKGLTEGAYQFSYQQISYDVREMRPYSHIRTIYDFSVQIPNTQSDRLVVSVEADHMKSYTAVGAVIFAP